MANRSSFQALFALIALLVVIPAASADWRSALPAARQLGSGEFTWFGFTVYTARLWGADSPQGWQAPFALELIYHRALSRDTLVQASVDEMRRLTDRPLPQATLERWTQAMHEAFVDVQPGTRITGLYLPGQGCRFYVDGQLRHEVSDPAFARAFFAIWLDPRARDPQLRQRLLGLGGD
ncbi:chalcone isomerase family protein [Pseudomonas sp. NPDC089752]|uniref:chalcone isomerase family protein n=1 Tax=Pseudomonas sp. NPDC089752 TaxID=3364472 RepID=UPI0037FB3EE3